jgi:flagellar hook-length control protein FliK
MNESQIEHVLRTTSPRPERPMPPAVRSDELLDTFSDHFWQAAPGSVATERRTEQRVSKGETRSQLNESTSTANQPSQASQRNESPTPPANGPIPPTPRDDTAATPGDRQVKAEPSAAPEKPQPRDASAGESHPSDKSELEEKEVATAPVEESGAVIFVAEPTVIEADILPDARGGLAEPVGDVNGHRQLTGTVLPVSHANAGNLEGAVRQGAPTRTETAVAATVPADSLAQPAGATGQPVDTMEAAGEATELAALGTQINIDRSDTQGRESDSATLDRRATTAQLGLSSRTTLAEFDGGEATPTENSNAAGAAAVDCTAEEAVQAPIGATEGGRRQRLGARRSTEGGVELNARAQQPSGQPAGQSAVAPAPASDPAAVAAAAAVVLVHVDDDRRQPASFTPPELPMTRLGGGHRSGGAVHAQNAGESPELSMAERVRLVGRVARAFHFAQERGGTLQLRLSPPELGSLRLELNVKDGVLTASMETETAAARRLLLDHLPALRDRLAEQNVRVERFDVNVRDGNEGQSGAFQQRQHGRQQERPPERLPSTPQTVERADTGEVQGRSRHVAPGHAGINFVA